MLDKASWRKALLDDYRRGLGQVAQPRAAQPQTAQPQAAQPQAGLQSWERPTQPVRVDPGRPTLEQVLRERGPFPALSGILGMCEDGRPMLFNLADATPGAVLMIGEGRGMAMTLAASAAAINRPSEVQVSVVTMRPAAWAWMASKPQTAGVWGAYEDAALRRIYDLAEVANQRRSGRERGAVQVLILDTLGEVWKRREMYVESQLLWLISHGARSGVWVVGVAPVGEAVPVRVTEGFGTRVQGLGEGRWRVQYGGETVGMRELEVGG